MKKIFILFALIILTLSLYAPQVNAITPYESNINKLYDNLEKAAQKDIVAQKTIKTSKNIALTSIFIQYPQNSVLNGDKQLKDFIMFSSVNNINGDIIFLSGTKDSIRSVNLSGVSETEKSKSNSYAVKYIVKSNGMIKKTYSLEVQLQQLPQKPSLNNNKTYTVKSIPQGYVFEGNNATNNIRSFLVSLGGDLTSNVKVLWYSDYNKNRYNNVDGIANSIGSFDKNSIHSVKTVKFKVIYDYDGKNEIKQVTLTQIQ